MDRFWSKVDQTGTGCWEWQGTRMAAGYGKFSYQGKSMYAHRMAWQLSNGSIPEGLYVLHRCDNPSCVRPVHLFLGTQRVNMHDAIEKGRMSGKPRTEGLDTSQWHLRLNEATTDVVAGVEHEQARDGSTRQDVVIALLREGLAYRRWLREQNLMKKFVEETRMKHGQETGSR